MNAASLVSIVVPSYNQGAYLDEALRSLFAQDHRPLEVLVADGGSDDGSIDVIHRYRDRLAWWTSAPDGGQAAALNAAFAHARGEILGWLASDDTLLPRAVSRVVEELERDQETLLVYGEAVFVDHEGRELFPLPPRPFDVAEMVRTCENHVVQPGSLFRRRAYEVAGPFDEDAYYFFDFQFALRLALHGRVKPIPARLATYRVHAGSKSAGASLAKARDYVRLADRFFTGLTLPEAERGRAAAYVRAGEYFYDALALAEARRYLRRGLLRCPSLRSLSLLAKAMLPRPVVERLRARRRSRRAARH